MASYLLAVDRTTFSSNERKYGGGGTLLMRELKGGGLVGEKKFLYRGATGKVEAVLQE